MGERTRTLLHPTGIDRTNWIESSRRRRVSSSSRRVTYPISYNFQRRMSRFPQRWRTQRNAIRHANCKILWIIKTLNAHCASKFVLGACLSECQRTPLSVGARAPAAGRECGGGGFGRRSPHWFGRAPENRHARFLAPALPKYTPPLFGGRSLPIGRSVSSKLPSRRCAENDAERQGDLDCALQLLISDQTRRPAEFKHIIKRRKRN